VKGAIPKISVVIPAYNAEGLIGAAIESVLAQTRPVKEIVVVDDGSTDGTGETARRYGSTVRLLRQENAGPSAARNRGIEAATGEWIAFVDTDDLWLPHKVEAEQEVLAAAPGLAWVGVNHFLRDFATGEEIVRFDPGRAAALLGDGPVLPCFVEAACAGLGWDPVGLLVRREVLLEAGGFRAGLHYAEDLDLCLSIARHHPAIGFHPEPAAVHLVGRTGSLSGREPVAAQMAVLHTIYHRHRPWAEAAGSGEALARLFRTIVQDQIAGLLLDGRRREMVRVLAMYRDILPPSYRLAVTALSLLPPGRRRQIYTKVQWRIRG
jgi:GT2 family glycosyltransferase